MKRMRRPLLFAVLLLTLGAALSAQDGALGATAAEPAAPPAAVQSSQTDTAPGPTVEELDIRTASLLELAAWCRELSLAESGSADELRRRLRAYYKLPEPAAGGEKKGRTVVVESARTSEYFTLESVNEEYARLSGNVVVTFSDDKSTHRIEAQEILFNRTLNLMTARGNVKYRKHEGDATETFSGDSLSVDVDDFSGVFLGGATEKSKTGDVQAYRFLAETIDRNGEVTILENATVENAASAEPYWSLTASKIWLLPGSDWAVSNALLKVGEIPFLYIPFFFLPGDELVVHPVFGYRQREGSYVQTTTYLLGQPETKSGTESSMMSMLKGDENQELRREGLYLRRTGKPRAQDNGDRLSILVDLYTNLGAYFGVESTLPKQGILGATSTSFGLALSRTVFNNQYIYTSSYPDGDWNWSNLFGIQIPLRYRLKSTGSLLFGKTSINWTLPFYSDPFIDDDFMSREETQDWFSMISSGAAYEDSDTTGSLSAYEWRLSTSMRPEIKFLRPYVDSISLSSFFMSLDFSTLSDKGVGTYNPARRFFYPDTWTIISLSGSIAGKPLSVGRAANSSASGSGAASDFFAAEGFGGARSPWATASAGAGASAAQSAAEQAQTDYSVQIPKLTQTFSTTSANRALSYELSYSLTPSFTSELEFMEDDWSSIEDINWTEVSSILGVGKLTGSLISRLSTNDNFLSATLTLNGSSSWQHYFFLNTEDEDYADPTEALKRALMASTFTSSAQVALSARPFAGNSILGNTSLDYSVKGLIAQSAFDTTSTTDNPAWELEYLRWDEKAISAHSLTVNLNAVLFDQAQSLSLSATLPPRDSSMSAAASIKAWMSTTSANVSIDNPFGNDLDDDGTPDPAAWNELTFKETLDLGSGSSLSQTVVWDPDPEVNTFTNLTTVLTYNRFNLTFKADYSDRYTMEYDGLTPLGWQMIPDQEALRPRSLAFGYSMNLDTVSLWKHRIKLSAFANTNMALDFQRYTQSSLSFSCGVTLKIAEFLDLSFTSNSQNQQLFRYVHNWWLIRDLGIDYPDHLETNFFVDLAKSFNFFNDTDRRNSGFKLKSLRLSAVHYMGDWTATLSWAITPYLNRTITVEQPYPRYEMDNEVSFVVKWTPVSEFKTSASYDTSSNEGFVIE